MPRHRLVSFRAGDDRGLAATGLTKAQAQVHFDRQNIALPPRVKVKIRLLNED